MKIEIGTNEAGQRIDKFLRKTLKDAPLSLIYKEIRKGRVKVNDKKVKENYFINENDIVEYNIVSNTKSKFTRVNNNLKITYEDPNILLVEKWPGVLVHNDSKSTDPTLTDYVLSYLYDKGDYTPENVISFKPSPCNRLDRNTSGIVIYGKNYNGLKEMNSMIRDGKIQKFYMSLVKGKIKEGLYEAYIKKDIKTNISKIYNEEVSDSSKISMNVKVINTDGLYSLLDIELITGKSHQLRAHLSHLGNPIIGDSKYGDKYINSFFNNKYGLNYQYLYAYKITFRECTNDFAYLNNKTISESLPPIFKKIKTDVFKF